MILSDADITDRSLKDNIIQPFDFKRVQPASYDFTLGRRFRSMKTGTTKIIDPLENQEHLSEELFLEEELSFLLRPGELVLGITEEYFKVPDDLAAKIEGKSSLGRIGLVIHSTAGWIDPGFQGVITLELGNLSKNIIKLTPGMKIGQICFMTMSAPAQRPYGSEGLGSKYQFSVSPDASMLYLENPANPKDPERVLGSGDTVNDASSNVQDGQSDDGNANADDKPRDPTES